MRYLLHTLQAKNNFNNRAGFPLIKTGKNMHFIIKTDKGRYVWSLDTQLLVYFTREKEPEIAEIAHDDEAINLVDLRIKMRGERKLGLIGRA